MCSTTVRNPLDLNSLADAEARIRKDFDNQRAYYAKYIQDSYQEEKDALEEVGQTRLAIMLLSEAGLEVQAWGNGTYADLRLGLFTFSKRDRKRLVDTIRKVRLALDCRLEQKHKGLADNQKSVEYRLRPVDFRKVTITFHRPLPRNVAGLKCRVVTERQTVRRLVCEA